MSFEPQVRAVRHSGDTVELDLFVSRSLAFFPDHFPRIGLLPGVIQVDWAIRLGRAHLPVAGAFRGVRALKFQKPVLPDSAVTLAVQRGAPHELAFAYRAGEQTYSSGRVLFAPDA